MMRLAFCLITMLIGLPVSLYALHDDATVREKLNGTGLVGHIHGSFPQRKLFVLTVRDEEDFSNFRFFTLIFTDASAAANLKRHDQVKVFGTLLPNPSEQRHILVHKVTVIQAERHAYNDYQHKTQLPGYLPYEGELQVTVHAVSTEKGVLVVDYGDAIVPVFIPDVTAAEETLATLHRGDIITLPYKLRQHPNRPAHMELNGEIEVLDALVDRHGLQVTWEGYLVMFPRSNQTEFNVFTLAHDDGYGVERLYTITNFLDPGAFARITKLLQDEWDKHAAHIQPLRNKLRNKHIRLRITGKISVIRQNQVNPMIIVEERDDIEVL